VTDFRPKAAKAAKVAKGTDTETSAAFADSELIL